jgi:6-phosphofructokinase
MRKRKIGILTGGGDCPGLNAVIRGVTKTAHNVYGIDVIGFYDGFQGLIENRFTALSYESVSGILTQGGTILGASNKANPFEHIVIENGDRTVRDVSDQTMALYRDLGLEALITVGGDGTMTIAGMLAAKGANVVGFRRPSTRTWSKPTPPSASTVPARSPPKPSIGSTAPPSPTTG